MFLKWSISRAITGDVGKCGQDSRDFATGVAEGDRGEFDIEPMTVAVPALDLDLDHPVASKGLLEQRLERDGRFLVRDRGRTPENLARLPSEHPLGRRVPEQDPSSRVRHPVCDRRVPDRGPKKLLLG
jgi:hypothetical protein